jgi:hypothetical protein
VTSVFVATATPAATRRLSEAVVGA